MHKVGLLVAAVGGVAALAWQQPPNSLPAPFATPSASNGPKVIAPPDTARLKLPAGFTAKIYAEGFQKPRYMIAGPGGEILLSDTVPGGSVYILSGGKYESKPADRKVLLEGLDRPYGLALWKDYLYVAEATSLKRYKYNAQAMTAGPGEEIVSMKGFDKRAHHPHDFSRSPRPEGIPGSGIVCKCSDG